MSLDEVLLLRTEVQWSNLKIFTGFGGCEISLWIFTSFAETAGLETVKD